jgi:hypothetical protein
VLGQLEQVDQQAPEGQVDQRPRRLVGQRDAELARQGQQRPRRSRRRDDRQVARVEPSARSRASARSTQRTSATGLAKRHASTAAGAPGAARPRRRPQDRRGGSTPRSRRPRRRRQRPEPGEVAGGSSRQPSTTSRSTPSQRRSSSAGAAAAAAQAAARTSSSSQASPLSARSGGDVGEARDLGPRRGRPPCRPARRGRRAREVVGGVRPWRFASAIARAKSCASPGVGSAPACGEGLGHEGQPGGADDLRPQPAGAAELQQRELLEGEELDAEQRARGDEPPQHLVALRREADPRHPPPAAAAARAAATARSVLPDPGGPTHQRHAIVGAALPAGAVERAAP